MLVGIDVCHKGKQSIIGFCATYDEHMCKYYTQASPQGQKGQEIISSSVLQEYFQNAFQAFRDHNAGALPDHIFIYRDGVGDSMRAQVIQHELEQLNKIMHQEYSFVQKDEKAAETTSAKEEKASDEKDGSTTEKVEKEEKADVEVELPKTTLIIVNKRVRQRFFHMQEQ